MQFSLNGRGKKMQKFTKGWQLRRQKFVTKSKKISRHVVTGDCESSPIMQYSSICISPKLLVVYKFTRDTLFKNFGKLKNL